MHIGKAWWMTHANGVYDNDNRVMDNHPHEVVDSASFFFSFFFSIARGQARVAVA